MDARRPRRRSPAIVACRGGYRESLNKGMFSRSSSSFCSAWPKFSSSFLHFHHLMAQLFLFLPFLFFYSFLLLLGFYLDFLILVFVLVRIMLDLLACVVDLLLFFTEVNLCGLICWFLLCHFLLMQPWASSLWVPMGLWCWFCCRPSSEFEHLTFSPIGSTFIYVLGSPVLVFNNASWRGFSTIAQNIITKSLWTLVPLVVCTSSFTVLTMVFCSLPIDSYGFLLTWCVEVFLCVWPFGPSL